MVAEAAKTHFDRTTPWEALGTDVRDAKGVADVLKRAGLDFEVETIVPQIERGGKTFAADDFRAVVRKDTEQVFNVAKAGYTPVQYADAFAFLDELSGAFTLESAGPLKGGARAWVQAKLDRPIEVDGDTLASYLTISTSHDGSSAFKMSLGTLRLACTNQLPIIGHPGASWTHRHSTNVMANAKDAFSILTRAEEALDVFEIEVRKLMAQAVTDRKFEAIVARLLPTNDAQTDRQRGNVEEQRAAVRAMYDSEIDGGAYKGTGWGVVNAFNSWNQWARPIRSTSDRAERQAIRTIDGTFGNLTTRVADLVLS